MNDFFQVCGNALLWCNNGEIIQIEPWGDNSLRIRSVMMGEILDTDFALLTPKQIKPQINITENGGEISNGKITAKVQNSGRISFYNQDGKLLLEEIDSDGALRFVARKFKPIIGGDFQLKMTFAAQEDEKIYGMGQYQQEIMDLKYCNLELAHRNSQVSVPFMLSSRGYGFFWHNPAIGRVSFGKNFTEWYAESTKQLDYWITAGDTPAEIVETYIQATGTPPMMPEYGMGFWQSKLRYFNQEQLLETAQEYKRKNLPIDVIVVDFFHWPKQGDWRFDEEFFSDPKAMIEELKDLGIELMVSVWPNVDFESENFEEMRQKGYLVKTEKGINITMRFGGDSVFFDATNPNARKYVWDKCKKNYYDLGIKIFWLDEAEPEYEGYDFDNYRYYIGPNVQIGNIYPQLYAKTFYDGMREAGQKDIVNLVRCAWAGSQRYGALVWSGDIRSTFEDFRKQVCAGLHMGIAGIPWWTTDIGGFIGGDPDDKNFRQLLVRWFQYGTFSPVMRIHGDRIPMTKMYNKEGKPIMHTGSHNEVWSFGEEAYEILKKYLILRENMRPYIRKLMRQAHEKGTPVMRPMFYEFPEDIICWNLKDQYMFGEDVLVAPVLELNATIREVYLPKGAKWLSANNGKFYEGGQTVECKTPLETIPIFLREGKQADLIGRV